MINKALVLAAGFGTRLGDLTKDTPKCLVDVGGKPIIDHVLWQLSKYNIDNVVINVHYHYEKIMKHLGDRVLYSYEPTLLNTAGTVKNLVKWFDDDILVVNGDTLSNTNYERFITKSIWESEDVFVLTDGRQKKCAGAYIIRKEAVNLFQIGKTIDECIERVFNGVKYVAQKDLIYRDCGTIEKLMRARDYYAREKIS